MSVHCLLWPPQAVCESGKSLFAELPEFVCWLQETMSAMAKSQGGSHISVAKLNNVLMQMRKNCNHPDLISGAYDGSLTFPSAQEMRQQCGKMQLLERMLQHLKAGGHKVLIFSQVSLLKHWCPQGIKDQHTKISIASSNDKQKGGGTGCGAQVPHFQSGQSVALLVPCRCQE